MFILLVKPSSLGDVVHAMPVARALIRAGHRVDWLVNSEYVELVRLVEGLGEVIAVHRERWKDPRYWPELIRSRNELGGRGYDLVLDLQGLLKSAWLSRGARPARVAGLADAREGSSWVHDVSIPVPEPRAHAIDRYLCALDHLGIRRPEVPLDYGLNPDAAAVERAWGWLPEEERPGGGGLQWIGLQTGTRWPTKTYPLERWMELVEWVTGRTGRVRWVVTGAGDEERAWGQALEARFPGRVYSRVGVTGLAGLVPFFRGLTGMVSPDTGPMHLAVACGVPVVGLFGPTRPDWTGPYGEGSRVWQVVDLPCVPCLSRRCRYSRHLACLWDIPVEEVGGAVLEWLA